MYDVIILGAGPAGLTAGIYAARGGLNAVIVESSAVGGQASLTAEIENYPGFESVNGFELVSIMQAQCDRLGVAFVFDNPVNVSLEGDVKRVTTAASGTLEARTVIIATGALPRTLGLPNESALMGGGVSYCATCDGAFFRGKPVAVVGGGNTAVEDALYLLKFASDVWLIHRRDALRADAILADRVKSSGVKIVWDSVVTELVGENKLRALKALKAMGMAGGGVLLALNVASVFYTYNFSLGVMGAFLIYGALFGTGEASYLHVASRSPLNKDYAQGVEKRTVLVAEQTPLLKLLAQVKRDALTEFVVTDKNGLPRAGVSEEKLQQLCTDNALITPISRALGLQDGGGKKNKHS